MKNILFFSFFLFVISASAQDTIVKKNGEQIISKILEIDPSQVKFKKFSFQDGPTYIELKAEISYIRFANGLKETFNAEIAKPAEPAKPIEPISIGSSDYYDPAAGRSMKSSKLEFTNNGRYRNSGRRIGEREMHDIVLRTKDKDIIRTVQSAKEAHLLQYVGFAAIPLGIASMVTLINGLDSYGNMNPGSLTGGLLLLGGAVACPIASGVFKHKRTLSNRKAVELYNERY